MLPPSEAPDQAPAPAGHRGPEPPPAGAGAEARTPLTYYGGKQRLARRLAALMPPHRAYLEPFAGGAAVLFAKPRAEREALNDLDGTIAAFWRCVRDRPGELAEALAATPYSRGEWRRARDLLRAGCPADDVEAARLLLVELDQSFSRSRTSWSVPCIGGGRGRWQPGSWNNLPPRVLAAARRLRGVALEQSDALDLIPRWDVEDAVVYCDPPYAGEHRREPWHGYRVEGARREGDESGSRRAAVEDLWDGLAGALLALRRARVVLSGYPCAQSALLEEAGWRRVPLASRRTVQARGGDALPWAPECAWLSPNVREPEPSLF
jgi:DNA adenine methylase